MKKFGFILIIIILLIVLGSWSPWLNWNFSLARILGLGSKDTSSGLTVFSLVGETEVYIDNVYQGVSSPESGNIEVLDVEPGIHEIKLIRKSTPASSYYELKRSIKFEEGIDVIISYELGPTKDFSEGHIFYAEKNFNQNQTALLNIISSPDKAKLYIDDIFKGETPISSIEMDLTKKHKIRLEYVGYDTIEFEILPSEQEERDKLKGYTLNLEINMFLIPLDVTRNNGEGEN